MYIISAVRNLTCGLCFLFVIGTIDGDWKWWAWSFTSRDISHCFDTAPDFYTLMFRRVMAIIGREYDKRQGQPGGRCTNVSTESSCQKLEVRH